MLGPHNAVDWLTGSVSNGAARKRLGSWLGLALIALTVTLQDRQETHVDHRILILP